jgi:hypothetical protein
MGVEFLQKTGHRIKVARDKALAALRPPISSPGEWELLRLYPSCTIEAGDVVQLELKQGKVVAVKCERLIGEIDGPMPELVRMLEGYGAIGGRIDEVHESACVADVEIQE